MVGYSSISIADPNGDVMGSSTECSNVERPARAHLLAINEQRDGLPDNGPFVGRVTLNEELRAPRFTRQDPGTASRKGEGHGLDVRGLVSVRCEHLNHTLLPAGKFTQIQVK